MPPAPPPPRRLTFREFLRTGYAKLVVLTSFSALGFMGFVYLNNRAADALRPRMQAAREALLGRPDDFARSVDAAMRGERLDSLAAAVAPVKPRGSMFENVPPRPVEGAAAGAGAGSGAPSPLR